MFTKVTIQKSHVIPVAEGPAEFVERKGVGHPDTICDRASEELSIALSEYYLENYGNILHHNVDKCVLAGGQAKVYFGGGEIIEPIYLLLVGRAAVRFGTNTSKQVPVGSLAAGRTRQWMAREFKELNIDSDIIIDYRIKPGSNDLVTNYNSKDDVPRANDTSFAVAFAPLTETENLVYQTERYLNSTQFKERYPAVGPDIKVMGLRVDKSIRLTVAAAIISKYVKDANEYMQLKNEITERVLDRASKITSKDVEVHINAADDPKHDSYYITVTGLSAEHGDDGQVGRGNRANGLITPFRPMTLEATAGKNPTSHVGKIYNVACQLIVSRVVEELPAIKQVHCYMLSQIGRPINEPQSTHVEAIGDFSEDRLSRVATPIVEQTLKEIPELWRGLITRKYSLF
ncbi:MAG: methionine adenosyltransferase [Conexivisphaerales archaeon]